MTGAGPTLTKPHIPRFHPTLRSPACPCLAATPRESQLCLEDSSSAFAPRPELFPSLLVFTPFAWVFGPDALHSSYPLPALLDFDLVLTLGDKPHGTWLSTICQSLLSAAPLDFTLTYSLTHPPPLLPLCVMGIIQSTRYTPGDIIARADTSFHSGLPPTHTSLS